MAFKLKLSSPTEFAFDERLQREARLSAENEARKAKATKTLEGRLVYPPELRGDFDGSLAILMVLKEEGRSTPARVALRQGPDDPSLHDQVFSHPSIEKIMDSRETLTEGPKVSLIGHWGPPRISQGTKHFTFEAFDLSIDGGPMLRPTSSVRTPEHPQFSMKDFRETFPAVVHVNDPRGVAVTAAGFAARLNETLAEAPRPFTAKEESIASASNTIAEAWRLNAMSSDSPNNDGFAKSMKTFLDNPMTDFSAMGRLAMQAGSIERSLKETDHPTAMQVTQKYIGSQAGLAVDEPPPASLTSPEMAPYYRVADREKQLKDVAEAVLGAAVNGSPLSSPTDPLEASVAAVAQKHAPRRRVMTGPDLAELADRVVPLGVEAHVNKLAETLGSREAVYAQAPKEKTLVTTSEKAAPGRAAGSLGR